MEYLENKTYDELQVGEKVTYSKTLTEEDIYLFAAACGDVNPVHLDAEFAKGTMFKERIAHGMWSGALISAALAMKLPGPGTIYAGQTLTFKGPVKIGDTVTVTLTVEDKKLKGEKKTPFVTIDCVVVNQAGKEVVIGKAEVVPPKEKMKIPQPARPKVQVSR